MIGGSSDHAVLASAAPLALRMPAMMSSAAMATTTAMLTMVLERDFFIHTLLNKKCVMTEP